MHYLLFLAMGALNVAPHLLAQEQDLDSTPIAGQPLDSPQIRYVSDQFYVPLRETPCPRCKIVHRGIKSGTELSLLNTEDGWGLVVTDRGVQGWMEQQHLADKPVARVKLLEGQRQIKNLQQRNMQLEQAGQNTQQQMEALRNDLNRIQTSKSDIAKELADIKMISASAITLNQQNQKLVKQNHMLQQENDVLNANLSELQKDKSNESFLHGGITVFLGALLVTLIPKLRGRKRLSEWR